MKPWTTIFQADWNHAAFIHFEIDANLLQKHIPFELDLHDGRALVSLVAFTQDRLRPAIFGRVGELLSAPLSRHEFLNLRTYVRNGRDCGIYFISEWIPNRLAALIGPATYGLPYRLGSLQYQVDAIRSEYRGAVRKAGEQIRFQGRIANGLFKQARESSIDAFLLERYQAYTFHHGIARAFRIAHEPWRWARFDADVSELSLLNEFHAIRDSMEYVAGHYSPGVKDVEISGPERTDIIRRRVYNGGGGKLSWRA